MSRAIRVGMVGSGFMAQLHSAAYGLIPNLLGDTVPAFDLVRIAGGRRVHEVGRRYGWAQTSDDWRTVAEADDIDVVDIVTPNDSHLELVQAATIAGKHVVCEKPLAPDLRATEVMTAAVQAAGVRSAVCFGYRTWPATVVAKAMIDSGRLGRIHGYRGRFLHDHLADRSDDDWRLDPTRAGGGVVTDIGSHSLDLARHLVGDITGIAARTRSMLRDGVSEEADLSVEFAGGAKGQLWLSWLATGTPMDVAFHVMGDRGAVRFTWRRPSQLEFYDATLPAAERGYRTIPLGPAHPAAAPHLSVAGLGLGFQSVFVPLLAGFLRADPATPTFADGLMVARYLDAAARSVGDGAALVPTIGVAGPDSINAAD